jgi:hypothetical protein
LQRYPFCVVYNEEKWNLEKRFSDFAELDRKLDEAFKGDQNVQVDSVLAPLLLRDLLNIDWFYRSFRNFPQRKCLVASGESYAYCFLEGAQCRRTTRGIKIA